MSNRFDELADSVQRWAFEYGVGCRTAIAGGAFGDMLRIVLTRCHCGELRQYELGFMEREFVEGGAVDLVKVRLEQAWYHLLRPPTLPLDRGELEEIRIRLADEQCGAVPSRIARALLATVDVLLVTKPKGAGHGG